MPARIFLINGPNLNRLSSREPEIYGSVTLAEIERSSTAQAERLGMALDCWQSNVEGDIVTKIQEAGKAYQGLIINGGAYTHTSIAIMDALLTLTIPIIEVHLSNPARREEFRHISYISKAATGSICGFGAESYRLAIEAIAKLVKAG